MRNLMVLILVLLAPQLTQARTHFGLYLDSFFTTTCIDTVPDSPVDVYIVVHDLPANRSIHGWEMQLSVDGSGFIVPQSIGYNGLNFAQFPSYRVGLPAPVCGLDLHLATITFIPMSAAGIVASAVEAPSLPDTPYPVYAYGEGGDDLAPLYHSYGSYVSPSLWVGPGDCPSVAIDVGGTPVENVSFSRIKALFR